MPEFYPPQLNPLFVRLCQSVSPWLGYWQYRMRLEISPKSLENFAAVRNHRLLLLSNHPTYHDWIATFLLSARIGEIFNYLAAIERFKGSEGKFLQSLGAYSVRRGLADKSSVAQTIQTLMQPNCRLVIFPEGGCSFQNDTVMPFRSGAIQMAFSAMSKIVKQGEAVPDLYTVPLSLKYRYTGDMNQIIDETLSRLENKLQVSKAANFYTRLLTVAEQVLVGFEKTYGLYTEEIAQKDWNDRIPRIRSHVLNSCEQKIGITSAPGEPTRERVYKIQHALELMPEEPAANDFWNYETIIRGTKRLLNFDAIYDGYVAANPNSERFLETLTRLEREVFGIDQPPPKGDRKVIVKIGEPINLKDYFAKYQQDKSGTITALTQQIQQIVQNNLN